MILSRKIPKIPTPNPNQSYKEYKETVTEWYNETENKINEKKSQISLFSGFFRRMPTCEILVDVPKSKRPILLSKKNQNFIQESLIFGDLSSESLPDVPQRRLPIPLENVIKKENVWASKIFQKFPNPSNFDSFSEFQESAITWSNDIQNQNKILPHSPSYFQERIEKKEIKNVFRKIPKKSDLREFPFPRTQISQLTELRITNLLSSATLKSREPNKIIDFDDKKGFEELNSMKHSTITKKTNFIRNIDFSDSYNLGKFFSLIHEASIFDDFEFKNEAREKLMKFFMPPTTEIAVASLMSTQFLIDCYYLLSHSGKCMICDLRPLIDPCLETDNLTPSIATHFIDTTLSLHIQKVLTTYFGESNEHPLNLLATTIKASEFQVNGFINVMEKDLSEWIVKDCSKNPKLIALFIACIAIDLPNRLVDISRILPNGLISILAKIAAVDPVIFHCLTEKLIESNGVAECVVKELILYIPYTDPTEELYSFYRHLLWAKKAPTFNCCMQFVTVLLSKSMTYKHLSFCRTMTIDIGRFLMILKTDEERIIRAQQTCMTLIIGQLFSSSELQKHLIKAFRCLLASKGSDAIVRSFPQTFAYFTGMASSKDTKMSNIGWKTLSAFFLYHDKFVTDCYNEEIISKLADSIRNGAPSTLVIILKLIGALSVAFIPKDKKGQAAFIFQINSTIGFIVYFVPIIKESGLTFTDMLKKIMNSKSWKDIIKIKSIAPRIIKDIAERNAAKQLFLLS